MAKTKRGAIPKKAAKPKAEKKPKARKARATAAEKSDDQLRALLFSHKRKLVPLLRLEAEAKAAVTKAFEVAKKEGVAKRDIKPTVAPDVDNLLKMLDALNEVVWRDDKQVVMATVAKVYSERPALHIEVDTSVVAHVTNGRLPRASGEYAELPFS